MMTWRRAAISVVTMLAAVAVAPAAASAGGATQITGLGLPGPGDCDAGSDGVPAPDYILVMTGDLDGCLYGYVDPDSVQERPSGTYLDRGTEVFVSGDNKADRFSTTYVFTAQFTDEGQQFGRCQHPIVSGEGAYAGATGRLDFKDNIVDGVAVDFSYRGHIKAG